VQTLILRHKFALGDTVLVTALVRDIQLAYPNQYRLMVDTHWTPVWWNNSRVVPLDFTVKNQRVIELSYKDGIQEANNREKVHFLAWFHRDFELKTGIRVPVTAPKGELFLAETEKQPLVKGRYWVILSGGKLDITTKHWHVDRYQQVIDTLAHQGVQFVQAGATHQHHVHPPLAGALNAVGRTENVRDLLSLIANADGVVCGVTAAMHIAACFDKPCVVLGGGREAPWWEGYVNDYYPTAFGPACPPVKVPHKYLHTLGMIYCCKDKGCWKRLTVPIDKEDLLPGNAQKRLCSEPVRPQGSMPVPLCLDMISVDHVVEAVMSYYEDGVLPPIGKPSGKYSLPVIVPANYPLVDDHGNEVGLYVNGQPESTLEFTRPPAEAAKTQPIQNKMLPPEIFAKAPHRPNLLSHPIINGKFTVCVLCYGNHPELAKRCIDSILRYVPPNCIDLRVACNECCPETLQYVRDQPITRVYVNPVNKLKYPVMREMFWDQQTPIETSHVIWFDDDSFVVDPLWLEKLTETIVANHPHGSRLYGWKFQHDFNHYAKDGHRPDLWFRGGDWYRHVNFRLKHVDQPAPNGSVVDFVAGGFWCVATEAIRRCGIPDVRLRHNGGDIVIGEMVRQGGFKIKNFNEGKKFVHSSGHSPRGVSHGPKNKEFPWDGRVRPSSSTV